MDAQVASAIIGGTAAIVAALITVLVRRRKEPDPAPTRLTSDLAFLDVTVDAGSDWRDGRPPTAVAAARDHLSAARWSIYKLTFDEGADLPLRVTLRNAGGAPVVISRLGVELVAGMNAWYTGIYYGNAPKAREIDVLNAYELDLAGDAAVRADVQRVMGADPDEEDPWHDLGALCQFTLPKSVLVEAGAPLVYVLNLKHFDKGMPTHTVLRLWLLADGHELRSDTVIVTFGR